MFKLDEERSARFLMKKSQYDISSQAHKLAKQLISDMDDLPVIYTSEISRLSALKLDCKQVYLEEVYSIIDTYFDKKAVVGSNMIEMGGDWYGVVYSNKKKIDLKIDYISSDSLELLEKEDGAYYHSRLDLERILPACLNDISLEMYKSSLESCSVDLLKKEAPSCYEILKKDMPEEGSGIIVSVHAQKRWIQRKLKIIDLNTDAKLEAYRREHLEEVNTQVLQGLESATKVWEDKDKTSYYFDADNIMYIVANNTVVTVYEEDFGFSKSINNSIVLQQLQVLGSARGMLDQVIESYKQDVSVIDSKVAILDGQLDEMQQAIDEIKSQKKVLSETRTEKQQEVMQKRLEFEKEYNKLFKNPIVWKEQR